MTMRTSAAGIAAIRQREGCKLASYKDPVGVWTIGVGHTGRASAPAVTAGMTITLAQADAYLAADLAPFEAAGNKAVTRPMTQNQFDAMMSLAFNIGAGGFSVSSVVRCFNAGDVPGAAEAFLLWNKAGGKVIPGLVTRRAAERAQFLSASQPVQATPVIATGQPAPDEHAVIATVVPSTHPVGFWPRFLDALFHQKAA